MKPFSTFRVVFPSFLTLILLSFITLYLFISNEIKDFYYEEKTNELLVHAELIANAIVPEKVNDSEYINNFCKNIDPSSTIRITVIGIDGQVVGDSHEDPNVMDNHISRPEIISTLNGNVGVAKRFSNTLQKEMLYLAKKYNIGNSQLLIRTSLPDESLGATLDLLQKRLTYGGLIIMLAGTILSYFISKIIANPIIKLTDQVHHIRIGKLRERIKLKGTKEILSLTESFNDLAKQLADRIDSITIQSNEQKAILTSLIEGIIATDNDGKIIRINPAANNILNIDDKEVVGQTIASVVQNKDLIYYFEHYLNHQDLGIQEITIPSLKHKVVQLYAANLMDSGDERIGSLFVITDISQIKKLERIRQDFVANVSHELKTPITTIKGFVETLEGTNIKDKKTIKKYLNFIAKNTDRMNSIITDLLELSRLEQQEYDTKTALKKQNLKLVMEAAIQECEYQANKKSIKFVLDCDDKIKAPVDIGLMTQAITNLIDNAIHFSNDNSEVVLTIKKVSNNAIISVADSGPGIETKHLTRLFERFYRADKSRSRKYGGTGLGLAIVKHIANIHNGNVSVESKVGQGSIFSMIIPIK